MLPTDSGDYECQVTGLDDINGVDGDDFHVLSRKVEINVFERSDNDDIRRKSKEMTTTEMTVQNDEKYQEKESRTTTVASNGYGSSSRSHVTGSNMPTEAAMHDREMTHMQRDSSSLDREEDDAATAASSSLRREGRDDVIDIGITGSGAQRIIVFKDVVALLLVSFCSAVVFV